MKRQKVSWIVLSVLVLLMFVPVQVYAAYEFYVTIEGTKQGKFKGESTKKGLESKFPGLGFQYELKSPRDAATGQSSGKRQHGAIVITKEWGASTPQLFQACVTNEVLKSVLIEFFRTDPNGQEYLFQTIRLTNATISNIKQYTGVPDSSKSSAKTQAAYDTHELEEISFTFQRIEITNVKGKTTAADSR
jgi:type VI secretion system secreted protein Hcp